MPITAYLAKSTTCDACLSNASIADAISMAIYGSDGSRRIRSIELVRYESIVADGAAIFVIDNDYVLFVAPEAHPDAATVQYEAMVGMAHELGPRLGRMILPIVATGRLQDRSFLVLPRCTPLRAGKVGRRVQKPMVVGKVLPWLRALASHGMERPSADEEFRLSLDALIGMPALPAAMRDEAGRCREAIDTGEVTVRHVPMHGDLWRNNIMRDDAGNLAIIDWAGSARQGYAIYDLVRFHQSFGIGRARFAAELAWYREMLGGTDAVMTHLLGGLGHYANRLGGFPKERFVAMAGDCYDLLRAGLFPSRAGPATFGKIIGRRIRPSPQGLDTPSIAETLDRFNHELEHSRYGPRDRPSY